ncbi:MAG: hypothetical protein VX589_12950, partial [Myxococcota bacterium]|nr:hypothetical protein [Myxococcota bacterium]
MRELKVGDFGHVIAEPGVIVAERFEVTTIESAGSPVQSVLAKDHQQNRQVRLYLTPLKGADVDTATIERRLTRAGRFVHKNVVPSVSSGRFNGSGFLAQAMVDGRSLKDHLFRRSLVDQPFTSADALNIVGHVCNGLQFARESLRHRTLSPSCVFILQTGRVQIGGFGFDGTRGRIVEAKDRLDEWNRGYFVPNANVDPDLAALGLLTLQILTGQAWPDGLSAGLAASPELPGVVQVCLARCLGDSQGQEAHPDPSAYRRALKRAHDEAFRGPSRPPANGYGAARGAGTSAPPPMPARLDDSMDQVEISGLHSVMDDSFSVPPLAGPGVQGDELSTLRWLVERDGVDYGPYTAQQLLDQLENDKISPTTVLCDLEADIRGTLAEFDLFEDKLAGWAIRKEDRAVAQREASHKKSERRKKTLTWGTLAIIIGGLAAIGGGWAYYQSTLPDPIKAHLGMMISPMEWALPSIELAPEQGVDDATEPSNKKKRKRSVARRGDGVSSSERAQIRREEQLAASSTLEMGSGTGASFDRIAFDRVINRRMRGIYRCLQSEVMRRPS